jgi:SsrA-binding protein
MKFSQQRKMIKKTIRKLLPTIENRRARFDYHLGDELTVGMSLTGQMVRAIRDGRANLRGSFITVSRGNELFLNNASLTLKTNAPKGSAVGENVTFTDRIKLLASKKEIFAISEELSAGKTLVPTKILTSGRFIKLIIAVGTGKKTYDKRETIRKRDLDREVKKGLV